MVISTRDAALAAIEDAIKKQMSGAATAFLAEYEIPEPGADPAARRAASVAKFQEVLRKHAESRQAALQAVDGVFPPA